MHLAWVSSQQGYQAIQVIQVFPQDLGKKATSVTDTIDPRLSPASEVRTLVCGTILPGHSLFPVLLEENVKLWLVYLDTREAERSGNVEEGEARGYGDGPGRETQVMDCRGPRGGG